MLFRKLLDALETLVSFYAVIMSSIQTSRHMRSKNARNHLRKSLGYTVNLSFNSYHLLGKRCFRFSEARAGIEPTHSAFAEPCLTTWLPRLKKSSDGGRRSRKSDWKETQFAHHRAVSEASDSVRRTQRKQPLARVIERPALRRPTSP